MKTKKKKLSYETIAIKINSKAEKLAATYFLMQKGNAVDTYGTIKDTMNGEDIFEYPYVTIDANDDLLEINGYKHVHCLQENKTIIPFAKIGMIEEMIEDSKYCEITVPLDSGDYNAIVSENGVKVGCQEISFQTIRKIMDAIEEVEEYSK